MVRNILVICLLVLSLNAFEYRAYDIGGNEIASQSAITLKGEKYTLLPFSYLDISKDKINLDGEFILLFGKVNGIEVEPIKLASNYMYQPVVIKMYDNKTLVTQSEEIFIDEDVKYFSIVKKD